MASLFVIDVLSERAEARGRLRQVVLWAKGDFLVWQCCDQAFGLGLVRGIPATAHADPDAMRLQHVGVHMGRRVDPALRMMDQARSHWPSRERPPEGGKRPFGLQGALHGPAEAAATVRVQAHCPVNARLRQADGRAIRHPEGSEPLHGEFGEHMRGGGPLRLGLGGPDPAPFAQTPPVIFAPHTPHTLMVDRETPPRQLLGDPSVARGRHCQSEALELMASWRGPIRARRWHVPPLVCRAAHRQGLAHARSRYGLRGLSACGDAFEPQRSPRLGARCPGPSSRRQAVGNRAFSTVS